MRKLNRIQNKIVHQKEAGVSVIKGGCHTGKTSVAMARMIYLLEHVIKKGEHVLFVSADEKTTAEAEACLNDYYENQNMNLFNEDPKASACIRTTGELIKESADKAFICFNLKEKAAYPDQIVLQVMKKTEKEYPRVKWLRKEHLSDVKAELEWMDANDVADLEMYLKVPRRKAGMKLAKNGNARKALWKVKKAADREMRKKGEITRLCAAREALAYLKEDCLKNCYEHMIIDDAQLLTKVELEMLYALHKGKKGELLFLMDPEQETTLGFLHRGKGFKDAGFDMTGRTRHLKVSVRPKKSVKPKEIQATPLELFMQSLNEKRTEEKKSSLPWYVETYKYVNRLTGVETVFQKDSSAGETYIDEIKQEDTDTLPVYSDIAAGMPIEIVEEVSGKFEMPGELLHHKKNTYILHVQGDSMIGADISDGDYVVIQAGNVSAHEIAAVYYNGATTLKRIEQEDGKVLLVSENPKYRPIVIEDGDFRVMGRLIGVIKPMM